MRKLPPSLILGAVCDYTKETAGYGFLEASGLEQVKKSVTPTLFIHGDARTVDPKTYWASVESFIETLM